MTEVAQAGRTELRFAAVNFAGLLFQSITFMAPAVAVVFALGVGVEAAGPALPLAVLLALIATLFVAGTIGLLAREMPSAGGLYTYASRSFGPGLGFVVGWIVAIYELAWPAASFLIMPAIMGQVIDIGWVPWAVATAIVALVLSVGGVRLSTRATLILGALEIGVMLALSIWMVAANAGRLTLLPFDAAASTTGSLDGVLKGMIFAILAFTGFEAAVFLGEEGKNPRRFIPYAVVLSALLIGLFFVFAAYSWVVGTGPERFTKVVGESRNPWADLGKQYWGAASILVFFALLNSVLGATVSAVTSGARIFFAMGRSGVLPTALGRVHPTLRTPHVATAAIVGIDLSVALLLGLNFGPRGGFVLLVTVVSILAVVAYMLMCLAAPIFFYRQRHAEFNLLLHGVVPAVGFIAFAFPLYFQFSPFPDAPIAYANWVAVAVPVIGIIIALRRAAQRAPAGAEPPGMTSS